ncbi:MAG: phage holin family protein [Solirubrobacterales bacterium]|nr:phage holin family protein [Solirubrobacterales bacterium]
MATTQQRSPQALRTIGYFARALVLVVVDGLALWGLAAVLPGIDVPTFGAALLTAALIALLNALVWPLATRILLPLTVLTFGLLSLVLNAVVVNLAIRAVDGTDPTVAATLLVALGLAVLTMVVAPLLDFDGDAYHLRVVRRRVREGRRANRTDVPGVIMFEIDGLAERVLEEAVERGSVPTIARWLKEGSHRIVAWECDLSSQTAASQAGLLHGSNAEMPAFRWYERDSGRLLVANHPKDAAEIERRHANGGGLLADGGASRGNMFSGDAPRCSATMSVIRDRQRSRSSEFFAYFADPYGMLRTIALSVADVAAEKRAYRRQRRAGAEHVDRGGVYPAMRAAITVVMRDLNVATLMADIVEGVPVAYSTFVGYDEVAHHSGIREPDAFAVLRKLDDQLERLERTARQAPRPYHLVVLSDHGQTQGAPFRQRHGETLEEVVRRLTGRGAGVAAPESLDEAWGALGTMLGDAREDPSAAGRILRRATSDRATPDGDVALGPTRAALREYDEINAAVSGRDGDQPELIVLASGCLGLVYFPGSPERLTAEDIERRHPGLLAGLAGHPGVGFVMVRSENEGAVALGGAGSRRLSDDHVDGEDPLAGYGENAADHLRRHDSFRHCPDILVNGAYDPTTDEVQPFEEFMGSHGGLGGTQMHPFAVVPAEWSLPAEPIVGAAAMNRQLRAWLAETGQ